MLPRAGFEPANLAIPELESGALDHSAILALGFQNLDFQININVSENSNYSPHHNTHVVFKYLKSDD